MEFKIIELSSHKENRTIVFELLKGQTPAQYAGKFEFLGDTFYRGMYDEESGTIEFVER